MNIFKVNRLGILVTAAIITVILIIRQLGLLETTEDRIYDGYFQLRGPQAPPENIAIIGIDDESIGKLGRWPWPRHLHAQLLDHLAQAKAVAFDLTVNTADAPEEDLAFANAIKKQKGVVLAAHFSYSPQDGDMVQTLRLPVKDLLAVTRSLGFVNTPTEKDNVVRRAQAVITHNQKLLPSLPLAAVMAYEGIPFKELDFQPEKGARAGFLTIPQLQNTMPLINFWGPARTFPTYSYEKVLHGEIPPEAFKDKIVFVGAVSPVFKDEVNNPYSRGNMILQGNLPVPGVEIHANAAASFQLGQYVYRAPAAVNILLITVTGVLAYLLTGRRKALQGFGFLFLFAVITVTASYWFWNSQHLWIDLGALLITLFFTYLGTTVVNFVLTEREKRNIQGLFGRYVNPQVVNLLLDNPHMVELGGKRCEVTVMFSDIRGFTAYSEGKQPEEVVKRLNEYFSEMTACVFKYDGTLDKYLGDGLMAVFGAPIETADHAQKAVDAAREMHQRLQDLNAQWTARGEHTFDIGIGLNSGFVLSGNIGSKERTEFTVIGETVNLASRLESLNKQYHSRIILSENTFRHLKQAGELPSDLSELGEVPVRGLQQPVKIYTLTKMNE
ncbi:CHASE2 domain-containing protein [Heliobacillus mobilis]|uniref:CHASE2 domain-containing protein n=1 Tax=Heliobacterium mobile TaxID=28064 RepID=A0A6I3SMD7_HELMO|nr:adenylate/guanylate cyclase domain-containing protein [Heliobacterium mobile]MTV49895.1 CHASE2 domain-containing protein [Heliobacterium mobile]